VLTKRSQLLLRQAQAKADELARHPVLGQFWSGLSLVLKGSTSRGNTDRYSDIDFVLYSWEQVKQAVVAGYLAQGLTDRQDSVFIFFPNRLSDRNPVTAVSSITKRYIPSQAFLTACFYFLSSPLPAQLLTGSTSPA